VIAAGDVTNFGVRRNPYLAAGAAHKLAERLMRARRLRRAQAKEHQQKSPKQANNLQNIPRQILIPAQLSQSLVHISRINHNRLPIQLGGRETHLIEQPLHHRSQAARTNIFRALIHIKRNLRQA
jgi:hypothetical protein